VVRRRASSTETGERPKPVRRARSHLALAPGSADATTVLDFGKLRGNFEPIVIEALHLTKEFGSIRAIDDVTFSILKGEIAGFLGPNGAGKTTTMRILTGVFPPTSGRVRIAGFDAVAHPLEARRRLGYFAENAPYYPDLTVAAYLSYVSKLRGIESLRRGREVARAMDSCDLQPVAGRLVGKLSKGYRQRVGLAQALLGDPEVLILDEPTIGLDPGQVSEIRGLIRALQGERTILLSSHVVSEVSLLCRRVIVINKGRILADDTPERLAERFRPSLRVSLRVEAPRQDVVDVLSRIPGVIRALPEEADASVCLEAQSEDALREVSRAIRDQRWLLIEMKRETLGLEEIFLSLVREEEGIGSRSGAR
jgi:gliding motility-associated transport system ATP-binding protein